MSKRRALYTTTPLSPETGNTVPPHVSEAVSAAYICPSAKPASALLARRKTKSAPDGAQPALPFEEDRSEAPVPSVGYTTTTGWIDASDRTRTWKLLDPQGGKVAEICVKRDAQKLADLLNHLTSGRLEPGP